MASMLAADPDAAAVAGVSVAVLGGAVQALREIADTSAAIPNAVLIFKLIGFSKGWIGWLPQRSLGGQVNV
ncbi:hypothetical protein ACSVHC_01400 [Arthrobacter sp. KNU-44]|uniref:hypothetical protein n=1 Tax=Arthrobacter sp. KNU-44 TaxID=3450744 RepID=UPI003F436DB3